MTYALGIDIGTTYSAAGVARNGRAEIAALGAISIAIPTAVYAVPDGGFVTAEEALRRGAADPDRLALNFKRRLGDPVPVSLGGHSVEPGVLLAEMLAWVRQRSLELEGGPPSEVVVTHPANWGDYKKDLLRTAISDAGFHSVGLLTEPEAAAIHYSSQERTEIGSLIAVYDLGGGTFDAALLRKTAEGYDFVGEPIGVERLGGIDFDDLMWGHVVGALGPTLGSIDLEVSANRRAVATLRRSMSQVKESLSSDSQVVVPVVLPGAETEIRVTRAEFEDLIRPSLEDTLHALHHLLDSAGVAADEVAAVLLVGGSSRIPLVTELVTRTLGRPVAIDVHPKFAVALGAALSAGAAEAAHEAAPLVAPGRVFEPEVEAVAEERVDPDPSRRRWAVLAVVVVLVAATVPIVWLGRGRNGPAEPVAAENTVISVTATTTIVSTTSTPVPTTTTTPPVAGVRLSASRSMLPTRLVLDGDIHTHWGAGDFPPQWIELDFGAERVIGAILLVTDQAPAGFTEHIVFGRVDGELVTLATLAGETETLQPLVVQIDPPATVTAIRVETVESPSWVAWAEIDIVEADQ